MPLSHAGHIGLSLKGNLISNNSIVLITDIGEEDDALLCTTNRQGCCANSSNRMGGWFFPNGMMVASAGNPRDIYRDRTGASSTSDATVRLNRRNDGMDPTGLYRCEIPDENGLTQNLYVGIHTDSKSIVNNLET